MKDCRYRRLGPTATKPLSQGFTLLEVIVVIVIAGILLAIAIPSWLQYVANRQVAAARDEIHQGIMMAQHSAMMHRSSWRFSLREIDGRMAWAVHANDVDWQDVSVWYPLHRNVVVYVPDTTLAAKEGTYYVRFGFQGDVRYRLSTVTLDSKNGGAKNKCVVISTLIGATRKGAEHTTPKGNRYCY
jgi:prepilin-type N-terminal cleavage/methylation domain-containing protein